MDARWMIALTYVAGGCAVVGALIWAYVTAIGRSDRLGVTTKMSEKERLPAQAELGYHQGSLGDLAQPQELLYDMFTFKRIVKEFKRQGALAIAGTVLSTVASVWSLWA